LHRGAAAAHADDVELSFGERQLHDLLNGDAVVGEKDLLLHRSPSAGPIAPAFLNSAILSSRAVFPSPVAPRTVSAPSTRMPASAPSCSRTTTCPRDPHGVAASAGSGSGAPAVPSMSVARS